MRTFPTRTLSSAALVVAVLLSLLAGTRSSASASVNLWTGPVWFQSGLSGECADVPGASVVHNVQLDQYPCVPGAHNEQWYLVGPSGAIDRQIRNRHSGQCLTDVFGQARQRTCVAGQTSQLWEITTVISWSDYTHIWVQNTGSHRCLTTVSSTVFTRLTVGACTSAYDDRWAYYIPADTK